MSSQIRSRGNRLAALFMLAMWSLCGGLAGAQSLPSGTVGGEKIATPELVKAACADGQVQLYTIQGSEDERAIVNSFESSFPCIKVSVISAVGPRLYERILGESQAGKTQADVIIMSDESLVKSLIDKKILRHFNPPETLKYPEATKLPGWWYTAALSMMYIIYNDQAVTGSDAPSGWLDMLDPKWKGKIATAPPTIGGTAWSLMAFLKMKYGDSYLKRLAAQQPKLYTAYQPVAQEVARGEFPVGMIGGLAEYPLRVGQGAPIHAVFPKDGVPYTVYPIVLTAGSAHPHAAELLANWYLSQAGQSREVEVRGAYSARYDVPSAKGNPPLASLHIWYPGGKMMAEQHDALINEFATLFGTK